MDVESVRAGVEMYVGDKGGVSRAYAWKLKVYAQASRVYTGVSKARTRAVGEQEDKHMGIRNRQ